MIRRSEYDTASAIPLPLFDYKAPDGVAPFAVPPPHTAGGQRVAAVLDGVWRSEGESLLGRLGGDRAARIWGGGGDGGGFAASFGRDLLTALEALEEEIWGPAPWAAPFVNHAETVSQNAHRLSGLALVDNAVSTRLWMMQMVPEKAKGVARACYALPDGVNAISRVLYRAGVLPESLAAWSRLAFGVVFFSLLAGIPGMPPREIALGLARGDLSSYTPRVLPVVGRQQAGRPALFAEFRDDVIVAARDLVTLATSGVYLALAEIPAPAAAPAASSSSRVAELRAARVLASLADAAPTPPADAEPPPPVAAAAPPPPSPAAAAVAAADEARGFF